MELRYRGFDQHDNTRAYKFDGVEDGHPIVKFVVSADLTLFLKHHLSFQEGPSLCASKLTAEATELGQHDHRLTDEDLLGAVTARADEKVRKAELRRKANRRRGFASRPSREGPSP
jgi:hypothetical protein